MTSTESPLHDEDNVVAHSCSSISFPIPTPSTSTTTTTATTPPTSTSTSDCTNNSHSSGILFTGGSRSGICLSISHQRRPDDRLVISWCTSSPRLLVPYPHDPATLKFDDRPSQEMLDDYVGDMLSKAFASASLRTLLSVRRLANTAPLPLFVELVDATSGSTTARSFGHDDDNRAADDDDGDDDGDDDEYKQAAVAVNEYSYMHVALFLSTLKCLQTAVSKSRSRSSSTYNDSNNSTNSVSINFVGCSFRNCDLTDRDVATLLNGLSGTLGMWADSISSCSSSERNTKFPVGCWPVHALDSTPTIIDCNFSGNREICASPSAPQLIKGLANFVSTLAPPDAQMRHALHLVLRFCAASSSSSTSTPTFPSSASATPVTPIVLSKHIQIAKATSDLCCQRTGICIGVDFDSALTIFSDPFVITAAKKKKKAEKLQQTKEHLQQDLQELEQVAATRQTPSKHRPWSTSNNNSNAPGGGPSSRTNSPAPTSPLPQPSATAPKFLTRHGTLNVPTNIRQLYHNFDNNNIDNNNNNNNYFSRSIVLRSQPQQEQNQFSASLAFFALYELLSRHMNIFVLEVNERALLAVNWSQEIRRYFASSTTSSSSQILKGVDDQYCRENKIGTNNHNNRSNNNSTNGQGDTVDHDEGEGEGEQDDLEMTREIKESLRLQQDLLSSIRCKLDWGESVPLWKRGHLDGVLLPLLAQCAAVVIQNHAIVRPNHLKKVAENVKKFLIRDRWCGWDYALVESCGSSGDALTTISSPMHCNSNNSNNNYNNNNHDHHHRHSLLSISELCSEIFALWSKSGGNPGVVVDRAFDAIESLLEMVDPWMKSVVSNVSGILRESYGLVEVHFAFRHAKMLMMAKVEKTKKMNEMMRQKRQQQAEEKDEMDRRRREKEKEEGERERARELEHGARQQEQQAKRTRSNSPVVHQIEQQHQRSRSASALSTTQQNGSGDDVDDDDGRVQQNQSDQEILKSQQRSCSSSSCLHLPAGASSSTCGQHQQKVAVKPLPPWGSVFASGKSTSTNSSASRSNSPTTDGQVAPPPPPRKKRELTKLSVRDFIAQNTRPRERASSSKSANASADSSNSTSSAKNHSSSSPSQQLQYAHTLVMKPDWIDVNTAAGRAKEVKVKHIPTTQADGDDEDDAKTVQHEQQEQPETQPRGKPAPMRLQVLRDGWTKPVSEVASRSRDLPLDSQLGIEDKSQLNEKIITPQVLLAQQTSINTDAMKATTKKHNNKPNIEESEAASSATSEFVGQNHVTATDKSKLPSPRKKTSPLRTMTNNHRQQRHHDINNDTNRQRKATLSTVESLLSEALIAAAENDPDFVSSAVSPNRLLAALLKAATSSSNGTTNDNNNNNSRVKHILRRQNEFLDVPSSSSLSSSSPPIQQRHPSIAHAVNGQVWNHNHNSNGSNELPHCFPSTISSRSNQNHFTPPRFTIRSIDKNKNNNNNNNNNHTKSSDHHRTMLPENSFRRHQQELRQQKYFDPCASSCYSTSFNHCRQQHQKHGSLSFAEQYELMKRQHTGDSSAIISCSSSCSSPPPPATKSATKRYNFDYQNDFVTPVDHQHTFVNSGQQDRKDQNNDKPSSVTTNCSNHYFSGQASYGGTTNEMLKRIRNFSQNQHHQPASSLHFGSPGRRKREDELQRESLQLHNDIMEHLQKITPSLQDEAQKRAKALIASI